MLLLELFGDDDSDVIQHLRDDIVDLLVPLAAHGVPFVTVDKIIDKMRDKRTGFEINKALVFQVLDPDKVKLIDKIEGDKIYFSMPEDEDRSVGAEQKQQEQDAVANKATAQAQQNMKN